MSYESPIGFNVGSTREAFIIDAGGRLRVSEIITTGDYKHNFGINTLLMNNQLINGATAVFDATVPGIRMSTSGDTQAAIHQTKQWHPYFAGKSMLQEFTMQEFALQTNIYKRFGYWSSNTISPFQLNYDGFWVESDGVLGEYYHVISKNGTITEKIPRSSWIDPLNGSGPSQIDANETQMNNFNIFATDFLWLGGSSFNLYYRYGKYFWLVNSYEHAGNKPSTAFLNPNQPIRYEMRQVGAGAGSFVMICTTVGNEGQINELGIKPQVGSVEQRIYASSTAKFYAVAGYKLQADKRGVVTNIDSLSLIETSGSNNDFVWEIRLNPTFPVSPLTYTDLPNAFIQEGLADYATNPCPNEVTGGIVLGRGYGSDTQPIDKPLNTVLRAGSAIDGTLDEIVLCVKPISNNQRIGGNISLLELV